MGARGVAQPVHPVGEVFPLLGGVLAARPVHQQVAEVRRLVGGREPVVGGGQFREEDVHRALVGDRVVQHGDQAAVTVPALRVQHPRGSGRQGPAAPRGQGALHHAGLQRWLHPFGDRLEGAGPVAEEGGAQGLVPLDDQVEGIAQPGRVETARDAHRGDDVVGAQPRVELLHQPQPALPAGDGRAGRVGPP
ncbi:hypothetical protein VR44_28905, partial [Streptomyces katrae]